MDTKQLKYFIGLANAGSFSCAADNLHVTQSALSRSIQGLEKDVGGKLIDRYGKRNALTPLGHFVLERANRVVIGVEELLRSAELMQEGHYGELKIALGAGPGAVLMNSFMQYMASHHPLVRLHVCRGTPELQFQKLRDKQLDAIIIDERSVVHNDDLVITPVASLRGAMLCRSGHPLDRRRRVQFEQLLRYPIASTVLSDELARYLVQRYGQNADPRQFVTIECEELSSLVEVAKNTDAIYMGILAAARSEIDCGALVELKTTPAHNVTVPIVEVRLSGRTEAPALKLLREFMLINLHD
jgi:DNA-binding transcriptional LysR family regulator